MRNFFAIGPLVVFLALGLVSCANENVYRPKPYYSTEEVSNWRQLAESGDAIAQHNLAVAMGEGTVITIDSDQALKWARKSARQEYPPSFALLGNYYTKGFAVTKNYRTAQSWFRKAVEHGDPDGQLGLFILYANGWGVSRDKQEAIRWLAKAFKGYKKQAENGSARARHKSEWWSAYVAKMTKKGDQDALSYLRELSKETVKQDQKLVPSRDPLTRLTDISVCATATASSSSGFAEWDRSFSSHIDEAKRRGISLQHCAQLTNKKFQDSYESARLVREREKAEDDKKKKAEAERQRQILEERERQLAEAARAKKAKVEADRKAEKDKRRKAELEHKRLVAIAEAEKRLEEENKRKAEIERKKLAAIAEAKKRLAAQEKLLAPLREKHRDAIAVIIGNRNYKGLIPTVDFAHNDAKAMKQFLLKRLGYREGNIIDLRDASRNDIAVVFGNEKSHEGKLYDWVKAGRSDVIVFYSGHGVPGLKDQRAYLLPVDGDANRAEITGFPVDTLYKNLSLTPARTVAVFIDACFSGESPKGMLVRGTSGMSVKSMVPQTKGRMTVITAAQGDQFASWDEKAKHGLFTNYLLKALYGAADGKKFGNNDGKVSLKEVQNYLDDQMSYQARRIWGRHQKASVQGSGSTVLAPVITP